MSQEGKFFPDWTLAVIGESADIKEAMQALTRSGALIACIVDKDGALTAVMTDSDVRRAILKGANVSECVGAWCQKHPIVARDSATPLELRDLAQRLGVREIPLVDDRGRLVDIFMMLRHEMRISRDDEKSLPETPRSSLPNHMLILAGGLGTRLRSIVNDRPKPLAVVGDKPILETLIMRAASCGITNFFVAVNYMAEQIEDFLALPQFAPFRIHVVKESKKLGTAGAIGLVKEAVNVPLLVGNADVLTTVPYDKIIKHHDGECADVTCSVRPFEIQVPYGVVDVEAGRVVGIREKPRSSHLVNAGLYVLSPEVCQTVEAGRPLDMPDLIGRCLEDGRKVSPFLLHEYWVDIGQPEDFHKANREYNQNFREL